MENQLGYFEPRWSSVFVCCQMNLMTKNIDSCTGQSGVAKLSITILTKMEIIIIVYIIAVWGAGELTSILVLFLPS